MGGLVLDSSSDVAVGCPYPCNHQHFDRAGILDAHSPDCGCSRLRPVVVCSCGLRNRLSARICRGCGKALATDGSDLAGKVPGQVAVLDVPGNVLHPPVRADDGLLFHTRDGTVQQVCIRPGAQPWTIGKFIDPQAGSNRAVVTSVPFQCDGKRYGLAYLTAIPRGIEALSLNDGISRWIYEAPAGTSIAAIRGGSRPQSYCGLACNGGVASFVVEVGNKRTLMALWLDESRPPEELLTLAGETVVGPLMCGERILVCTECQVGLYDARRGASIQNHPAGFVPLTVCDNDALNLSPGALPMALSETSGVARTARVFGTFKKYFGVLEVKFDSGRDAEFRPLSRGGALSTMADGSVCLAANNGIFVYGESADRWVQGALKPWMPAAVAQPFVIWFEDHAFQDRQRVAFGANGKTFHVEFTSPMCTSRNYCGAYRVGDDFAVAYFDVSHAGEVNGLQLAIWSMKEPG